MRLDLYLESGLSDLALGLGGTIAGSIIAGKIIKDPYEKERKRVDDFEKKVDAQKQAEKASVKLKKRRAILRQMQRKSTTPAPTQEGLIRTVLVGAPKAAWRGAKAAGNFLTKHPVGSGLTAVGMGAAYTGMDRAAAYATMKKDRQLAMKAAQLELEKEHGKDKTAKIAKRADERAKKGKYYDEGALPPRGWITLARKVDSNVADEEYGPKDLERLRGDNSRKTNGYSPENNPQTHSGYTKLPAENYGVVGR